MGVIGGKQSINKPNRLSDTMHENKTKAMQVCKNNSVCVFILGLCDILNIDEILNITLLRKKKNQVSDLHPDNVIH